MGLLGSVKEKLSQDPPPLEEAIREIADRIKDDVMKGNFDEAQKILENNLNKLENGEFKKEVTNDGGKSMGYNKNWPEPEEEASQLVNYVFLELLELVVEDLETVEGGLEPPIKVRDVIKNEQLVLEDGIEGEIEVIEEILGSYNKEDVKGMSRDQLMNVEKLRSAYEHADKIRKALGTENTSGGKDAVEDENYRTKHHRKWREEGKYKENMGVLITVKMAERHLEFIQKLAKWEHAEYGLDINQGEKKEINEVKKWLNERFEIIKELDQIIHPFVLDAGAEAGVTKEEAFKNPEKSLQRLSKADQVLEELHELERKEDQKIKNLDQMISSN